MPLSTTKKLFRMLRPYHPEVPKDPRTLMKAPRTCISKPLNKGNYVHLGLERGLWDQLHSLPVTTVPEMHIQLHIDGMKIFKGSSQDLWPILGRIRHPVVGQPFIAGVFSGLGKPDPLDDFLGDCVGELKDLLASGLRIPHTQNSAKVILDNAICDTPARCFVRQVQAHNGYYGCDRNKFDFPAEQMIALNNSVQQLQATMTDAVSALERGATAADVGPSCLHLPSCTAEAYENIVRRLTTEAELTDKAACRTEVGLPVFRSPSETCSNIRCFPRRQESCAPPTNKLGKEGKDLVVAVQSALTSGLALIKGNGSTESFVVGDTDMPAEHLRDNILSATNDILAKWPGGLKTLRSVYVRGAGPSIPLYFDETEVSQEAAVESLESLRKKPSVSLRSSLPKSSRLSPELRLLSKHLAESSPKLPVAAILEAAKSLPLSNVNLERLFSNRSITAKKSKPGRKTVTKRQKRPVTRKNVRRKRSTK
ncbi:hypothetical protein SprV_0200656600 [Sparganum proliferum]